LGRARIEQLAIAHMKISPLKLWSKRFLSQHPNPKLSVLREIVSSARLFSDPRITGWINYRDRIKKAFTVIWFGKQSPDKALASIR
jgi:hypothetical protein